ncbi:MAG: hypothetical protein ACI8W8_004866, partial [Rhodothermales bacterium]
TNGATIDFSDGASFANPAMHFEHKGTNIFAYTLSSTGFGTMTPNFLFSGAGATWPNATYNLDISAYDVTANGGTVILADYSGTNMPGAFNPTINIISTGTSLQGSLAFDIATSSLVLTVIRPGSVFRFQ